MYSVVLTAALLVGGETAGFKHGCHGCHSCHSSCHSCYSSCHGCHGCYSSCCYSNCSSCYSSCSYSYCSGCYSSCSCYSGCYNSCSYSYCSGCYYSGGAVTPSYGVAPVYAATPAYAPAPAYAAAPQVQPAPIALAQPSAGNGWVKNVEERLNTLEKVTDERSKKLDADISNLTEMVKKLTGSPATTPGAIPQPTPVPEAIVKNGVTKFTVQMPAGAKLYVNDVHCPLQNGKQSFNVANLQAGQNYAYSLRLEVTNNGQATSKTQQVVFQAGQHVQVNFNATNGIFTVKN